AASGGEAPIDLGESAYRDLAEVLEEIEDRDLPLWRISPFMAADEDPETTAQITAAPSYRGDFQQAIAETKAHLSVGGTAVVIVIGSGMATRTAALFGEAEVGAVVEADGLIAAPRKDTVTITCGRIEDGLVLPQSGLTII